MISGKLQERKAAAYLTKILRDNNFKVIDNFLIYPPPLRSMERTIQKFASFALDALHLRDTFTDIILAQPYLVVLPSSSRVVDKTGGTVIILGCPGEYRWNLAPWLSKEFLMT